MVTIYVGPESIENILVINCLYYEKNRLQSVIKKAIRYGYRPRSFSTLGELSEDSDEKTVFLDPNHVLHCLLPEPKTVQYNLRQHTHDLTLLTDVSRMLFSDIY